MSSEVTSNEEVSQSLPVSAAKKAARNTFWSTFFFFFLILFTFSKLPETKITNLMQGYLQAGLDPLGIYITDHGREFSLFHGFRYRLIHPTLELADQTRIELDEITAAPDLMTLITGKIGASLLLQQGASQINVNGSVRGSDLNATLTLDQVDLGKWGVLAFAGGLKGSGLISGTIHLEGSMTDNSTLVGEISLKLSKIKLEEQNLMGFQLPALSINEGVIDIPIEKGKLVMKTVSLGKPKSADDLNASLTGDITLNKFINMSSLNLRAVVGLSEKVMSSLALLDSLMAAAKQSDGRYAYKLTGTPASPFAIPDPK